MPYSCMKRMIFICFLFTLVPYIVFASPKANAEVLLLVEESKNLLTQKDMIVLLLR